MGDHQHEFDKIQFVASTSSPGSVVSTNRDRVTLPLAPAVKTFPDDSELIITRITLRHSEPPNVSATLGNTISFIANGTQQVITFLDALYDLNSINQVIRDFTVNAGFGDDLIVLDGNTSTQRIVFIVTPNAASGDVTIEFDSSNFTMQRLLGVQGLSDVTVNVGQTLHIVASEEADFNKFENYVVTCDQVVGTTRIGDTTRPIAAIFAPTRSTPGTEVIFAPSVPSHLTLPGGQLTELSFTITTDQFDQLTFSELSQFTVIGYIQTPKDQNRIQDSVLGKRHHHDIQY